MKVAEEAQQYIDALFALIPKAKQEEAAIHIARLFNMGIRVSPRPVQGTVRINAIQKACANLPITCRLERVEKPASNGYPATSYNALRVVSKSGLDIPDPLDGKDEDE
jgi:hypothetical protein